MEPRLRYFRVLAILVLALGLSSGFGIRALAADEIGEEPGVEDQIGTGDEATEEPTDEGTADEGTTDEGTADEGTTDEGTADEGTTDEGSTDDTGSEDATGGESLGDDGSTGGAPDTAAVESAGIQPAAVATVTVQKYNCFTTNATLLAEIAFYEVGVAPVPAQFDPDVDCLNQPLDLGAGVDVFLNEIGQVGQTATTDGLGQATFTTVGDTAVADVEVTVGEVANGTSTTFTIPLGSAGAAVTITNFLAATGDIQINKTDSVTLLPLAGAGFTLYDATCTTPDPNFTEQVTDIAGLAAFTGVAIGDYCVVETTVPTGYLPVANVPVTVTLGGIAVLDIADDPIPVAAGATVDIQKYDCFTTNATLLAQIAEYQVGVAPPAPSQFDPVVDCVNQPLDVGVGVEVTLAETGQTTQTATTDALGQASFATFGDTTLGDVEVTVGETANGTSTTFTIPQDSPGAVVTITNFLAATGDIEINKTDELGGPLAGAGFTLYDATCTTAVAGFTEQVTDAAGFASFTGVTAGDYCVVESTVPAGYLPLDPTLVTVVFGEVAILDLANELVPTGQVLIRAFLCSNAVDDSFEIEVSEPSVPLSAAAGDGTGVGNDNCVPINDLAFEIFPDGDLAATPITGTTDDDANGDGTVLLNLPVGTHLFATSYAGFDIESAFAIAEGGVTGVSVIIFEAVETPTATATATTTATATATGTVSALPSTGAGSPLGDGGTAWFLVVALGLVALGSAGYAIRRRAA
jgi:hypothetical protein